MSKPRKMLGAADSPYIVSLMLLIETQSKPTIVNWCLDYTEEYLMPLCTKHHCDNVRLLSSIDAARRWLEGEIKLPDAKKYILDAHCVARELEGSPAAQASARAVGQSSSTIHSVTHALGMAFYGSAAVAYDRVGLNESPEVYDTIAAEECARQEAALRTAMIVNEPHPAKVMWNC